MKERIENRLGILLSDEGFKKAVKMADAKLRYIIRCAGDADGQRNTEEYREQLIYEAALHNAFTEELFGVAVIMQDMKKECLEKPEHPYTLSIS